MAVENICCFSLPYPNIMQYNKINSSALYLQSILNIIWSYNSPLRQGWVMGIISISQPGSERLKNLPRITQLVSGRAGLLLQLLESHPRAPSPTYSAINLEESSKCYMIERRMLLVSLQKSIYLQHTGNAVLSPSVQHWSIQSYQASIWLYWTGGWVRNKNQTGLGDVRTTLPSCTTEERNALTGRTKSDKLPSGSPRWVGYCCPYLLRVVQ